MAKPFKILIVDDEPNIVEALRRVLRMEKQWEIVTAGGAKEALAIVEKNSINLIISDNRMPEMFGVELFKRIKNKHPEISRILLSGYSDFSTLISAINEGEIYRFLSKPWNNQELINIIRQISQQHEAMDVARGLVGQIQNIIKGEVGIKADVINGNPDIYLKVENNRVVLSEEFFSNVVNLLTSAVPTEGHEQKTKFDLMCMGGVVMKREGKVIFELDMGKGARILLELPGPK